MGIRENKVETYLDNQVVKRGGLTRKWVSPGHRGVMDRIVRMPLWEHGKVCLVEVKTGDGTSSPRQLREAEVLKAAGCWVVTLFGETGVDFFMASLDQAAAIKAHRAEGC